MTCNQIIAGLTVVKSVYTKVIKPVITTAIKKFKKLSETGVFSEDTMAGFDPEESQTAATTETTENSEPTKEESKKENLLRKVNTTIKWLAKMATVMGEAALEACDFLYDLLADVVTAG